MVLSQVLNVPWDSGRADNIMWDVQVGAALLAHHV